MPQRQKDIKFHEGNYIPIPLEEQPIEKAIVNAAYLVHKELGDLILCAAQRLGVFVAKIKNF